MLVLILWFALVCRKCLLSFTNVIVVVDVNQRALALSFCNCISKCCLSHQQNAANPPMLQPRHKMVASGIPFSFAQFLVLIGQTARLPVKVTSWHAWNSILDNHCLQITNGNFLLTFTFSYKRKWNTHFASRLGCILLLFLLSPMPISQCDTHILILHTSALTRSLSSCLSDQ